MSTIYSPGLAVPNRAPYMFSRSRSAFNGPDPYRVKDQLIQLQNLWKQWGPEEFMLRFCWIQRKQPEKGEKEILPSESTFWNRNLVPFHLNSIQKDIESKLGSRNIFLKPRQAGYTTYMIIRRLFLPCILNPGHNGLLISQTGEYATAHFRMLKRVYKLFAMVDPYDRRENIFAEELHKHLLHTVASNRKEIIFDQIDCAIRCASAEVEEVGQGLTLQHVVATEVARWEGNPEATLANMKAAIPKDGTFDMESTANGHGGYFFEECYDKDTEVLTKRGWLRWKEVTLNDKFATRDTNNNFVWQRASKLHQHYYEGNLVKFNGRAVDLLVTPNHRMLGWKTADHLTTVHSTRKRHKRGLGAIGAPLGFMSAKDVVSLPYWHGKFAYRVPATTTWTGHFPNNYNKKTRMLELTSPVGKIHYVNLKDWVAFLGIYVAEGSSNGVWRGMEGKGRGKCVDSSPLYIQAREAAKNCTPILPNGRHGSYHVSITQTKKGKGFRKLQKLLASLPFEFTYRTDSFYTTDKTLHFILSQCGNCYTKHIPLWVKELPVKYLKIFLKWAVLGDGWIRNDDGAQVYGTSSKKLAGDVQELFQKTGVWATIGIKKAKIGTLFGKVTQFAPFYTIKEHRKTDYQSLNKGKLVKYKGFVYCATVPNGTLYVRRNGFPLWCGNCMRARDVGKGYREFTYHFHEWWWHDEYFLDKPLKSDELTKDELLVMAIAEEHGKPLSLFQMAWRRKQKEDYRGDFDEKYPENDLDCFLLTGGAFFDKEIVRARYKELLASAPHEKHAKLEIYKTQKPHRQYVIGADVASGLEVGTGDLDWSVGEVIDLETGEQVAEYRSQLLPEEFAWDLADLGERYNNALIAVERNNEGGTVILTLERACSYMNLYKHIEWFRRELQKRGKHGTTQSHTQGRLREILGFPTNQTTRPLALNRARFYLSEHPDKIHSVGLLEECSTFVRNQEKQGRPEGGPGCHDDRVLAWAISQFVRAVKLGYLPTETKPHREKYGTIPSEYLPEDSTPEGS